MTIAAQIVTYNDNHLVQFWSDLNAARKSCEAGVPEITFLNTPLLCDWLFVQLFEPGIGDVNTALSTVHTRTVEVNWDLVRSHRVLFVATVAVWEHSWDLVSFHHFEETFA